MSVFWISEVVSLLHVLGVCVNQRLGCDTRGLGQTVWVDMVLFTSPRRGLRGIVFTLSVCLANILVFYFSAIRRDIDTGYLYGCTQFTNKIDLHRSKVKVTGTVHHITKTEP